MSWKNQTQEEERGMKPNQDVNYFQVLGRRGVGKTNLINFLTGSNGRLGSKQTDGTGTINLWNGNDVGFIDTPGFGDKGENSPIILMNRIRQFLRDSSVTVRGILIVNEFTSEIGLEMDFIVQVLREFFIFDGKWQCPALMSLNDGGQISDEEFNTQLEIHNQKHKWQENILWVRTKADKRLDRSGNADDGDYSQYQEEIGRTVEHVNRYFQIAINPLKMICTGQMTADDGSTFLTGENELRHALSDNRNQLQIRYNMNDWALAKIINDNLRFKLGGLFIKPEDLSMVQDRVKPSMRGTKRKIVVQNEWEAIRICSLQDTSDWNPAEIPTKKEISMEVMVGETIGIASSRKEKSIEAIYIVEHDMKRGKVVISVDANGQFTLDHQNHSEILETIGTCLDDWSNEKQQEDLAVMEKDINNDGGRRESEPKSRASKSQSNEGQGTENNAQYTKGGKSNGGGGKVMSIKEIMKIDKNEKERTKGIRRLMGILGNSFTVDLEEQNQRQEFQRAYLIFQEDIITEYARFGFDMQGLQEFVTILWKRYKRFVDRCLGIETAFDLMNKKREIVKKILDSNQNLRMFDKYLDDFCSGELKFGTKINNLKADAPGKTVHLKIFNRCAYEIVIQSVSQWPLKQSDKDIPPSIELASRSDEKFSTPSGSLLLVFEKERNDKPIAAYKPLLGKDHVMKIESNGNCVVSDDLEAINQEDLVMINDSVKFKLFVGGDESWKGANFTKFMVAKSNTPLEDGTNPNLTKMEMRFFQMQEDERRELVKAKAERKLIINLQMSVGDTETNKLTGGYFDEEKYLEESHRLKEAVYKLCGPNYFVSINTLEDDSKWYEGVFDIYVGDKQLWVKDFKRPWPPFKALAKKIKHELDARMREQYLQFP